MKKRGAWWSLDPVGSSIVFVLLGVGVATLSEVTQHPTLPAGDFREYAPFDVPQAPPDHVVVGPMGPIKPEQVTASSGSFGVLKPSVTPMPPNGNTGEEIKASSAYVGEMPFGSKGERVGINFLTGRFLPNANERIQPDLYSLAALRSKTTPNASVYGLILFNGRLDSATQAQLEQNGVKLLGYYPETAYRAEIPCSNLEAVARIQKVLWIGQPNNRQKLDPSIYDWVMSNSNEARWVFFDFFGPDPDGSTRQYLASTGAKLKDYDTGLWLVTGQATPAQVRQALASDAVLFVQPIPIVKGQHAESMVNVSMDYIWGAWDGTGGQVLVGIMDSGFNVYHSDAGNFAANAAGYERTGETSWYDDLHGHGTHVMGTFLGRGSAEYRYRGGAQGIHNTGTSSFDVLFSKVLNQFNSSVGDSVWQGLLDMQSTQGGRNPIYKRQVYNCSIGGGGSNLVGTDDLSRKVDEMFNEGVIGCIAAGNNGPNASTVTYPGVAKNAITAANIIDSGYSTIDTITGSSGRGYTGDGRVKPDLAAPGNAIDSLSRNNNTGYTFGWSGTSMASPHVAAVATSLLHHYPGWPSWAYKSIMLATAIDLPALGVTAEGRGKIDARLSNYVVDSGGWNVWWGNVGSTGNMAWWDITIASPGLGHLRLVLTWPDPPAASGASLARVNDIDLGLQSGALNTAWSGGTTWSSTTGADTVELIDIPNLPAGTYRIKVYNFAGGAQAFAVTAKYYRYSLSTSVGCSISGPAAVKPNVNFTLAGTATNLNNIGSGTWSQIEFLTGGCVLNGVTNKRRAPNGSEESYYYSGQAGVVNGNIEYGVPRYADWSVYCTTEGTKTFRVRTKSSNGGETTSQVNVIVDGTGPINWGNLVPNNWVANQTPSCSMDVQDTLSGLDTGNLYYWYYKNGTQYGPFFATTGAPMGTTAVATITATNVPFNLDNSTSTTYVYFRAYDRAGNFSDSGWQQIFIDTTIPGNWANFSPGGYTYNLTPTCTVDVQDTLSGLQVTQAYYRYSTNGGTTWSAWFNTPCTGSNGTTAPQTITAANVPFNQYSGSQNKIQFAVYDMVWNLSVFQTYNVAIGAIVEHNAFTFVRGSTATGSNANLFASDDVRWNLRPGPLAITTLDPIEITLSGTAPTVAPSSITVVIESSASVGNIRQIVEARNFNTSTWTLLDTHASMPTSDLVKTLSVPNPAQHKSGTNEVQVRLRWKNMAPVSIFPWNARIDRLYWIYNPS